MTTPDKLRKWRDAKVAPHLEQYAPVWLESETIVPDQDAIVFNVVFRHPSYGWVSRRYRYDGFNDVLYYSGQRTVSEDAAMALQDKTPYVDALQSDVANSYGG